MKLRSSLILPLTLLTALSVLPSTGTLANPSVKTSTYVAQKSPYQPIPDEYCRVLRNDAQKALGTTFTLKKGAFTDYLTGERGTGCIMSAKGTGVKFRSPATVVNKLKAAFIGWEENTQYQADGPTGKATAFTRDQGLLLVNVEWEPAPWAKCSRNVPIGECNLRPAQQIYTIKLAVAMK
jgi:hypothetical protein